MLPGLAMIRARGIAVPVSWRLDLRERLLELVSTPLSLAILGRLRQRTCQRVENA
jgi:hypothetical protein